MPHSRPFPPLSLSVRLHRPRCAGCHGESKKREKGQRSQASDVGYGAKAGLGSPSQRVILCLEIPRTKPLSSLINKTSHPFALIPQAAHMQECATQGKSYKGKCLHVCSEEARKKFHNFYCFYVSPFISAGRGRLGKQIQLRSMTMKKKIPLKVSPLCSLHKVKAPDDLHQG